MTGSAGQPGRAFSPPEAAGTEGGAGPVPAESWRAYWSALSAGDSPGAVRVALELRSSGIGMADILDGLVSAAQSEVGRLWAANQWNVAQEHRATSVSEEVVAALAATVRPTGDRGTAVVTCVDGEWHALASRVVASVLREGGWQVHYLGASVPVAHLAQFLQDAGPDVTALSCSVPTALPMARQMVEASREVGVPVIAGGPGFGPAGRWGLVVGANGTARDARRALRVLSDPGWPTYADPAPPMDEPDRSARLLRRHRGELVGVANQKLFERWPAMAGYDDRQLERTEEDLSHLVEFLAAALFVDDPELYTGFIRWMGALLAARHVPRPALTAGLEVTGEAVAEVLGEQPRAQRFLSAALSLPE